MTTLDRLGADDLRRVIVEFRDGLRAHQDGIDRLNVYPVPDGDTGTNMALTLESVVTEVDGADAGMVTTCKAISHGSLMGARGNSGVILSQVLRGFCEVVREADDIDGELFAQALGAAAKGAYTAVMRPVEGTILTVVREAAEAAEAQAAGTALVDVLDAALTQGNDALGRTPDMLAALAEAGVVDAGGTGFLLFLHACLHVAAGRPMPEPAVTAALSAHANIAVGHGLPAIDTGDGHGDVSGLRYEVMYFLEASDETVPAFKDVWAGIGDSIVVVGGDGMWNCHIHTNDIGAAIEAAIDCGRPRDIRVTDLLEQVEEERWVREAGAHPDSLPEAPSEPVTTGVVAIATGDGIRRIFHSLGVHSVLAGGQSMNPSTAQILEVVEALPAEQVVLLPNNKNIIAVAEQVDGLTDKTVRVVPTRSIPEGFAALLEYDPEADVDHNVEAMADAATNVVAGEVTKAVRPSSCDVGPIAEGDFLGIGRSGIVAVKQTPAEAVIGLLAKLLEDEHELVTLIEGDGSSVAATRRVREWVTERRPDVTVEVHQGGQPLYPYFVGLE